MEVSGRIDKDEAADEFDDGGDTPIARVWPLLSKSLKAVMNELDDYPSLPFTVSISLFCSLFTVAGAIGIELPRALTTQRSLRFLAPSGLHWGDVL